ncbi:MAG: hypothetical protein EOP45_03085 [Sphingobacteriaceae bacterium]|nr:MAG: hypothetical protein EOP45_03085 [Sphingobacteriaceae bacterium]
MQNLINSVQLSISTQNWYAAVFVVLTLPDIAGKIEYPTQGSQKRYAQWFEKYCGDKYKQLIGGDNEEVVFLSGNDCYALRCSLLHEGNTNILTQRAREILDEFIFTAPSGYELHCNKSNNKLQLQSDIFCNDIIEGINQWLSDINNDAAKQIMLEDFIRVYSIVEGFIL